ncbi:MAG: endonuclease/exonuclease/phosphatase family protein, partial [Rhodospirillales bacterium]
MTTIGMLSAVGLAFVTPLHSEPQKLGEESSVRVMTYNIYRGGEMRGQKLSQAAKVIQEAKADIVGIQEPRSPKGFTTEKLANLLGWNHSANIRKGIILT